MGYAVVKCSNKKQQGVDKTRNRVYNERSEIKNRIAPYRGWPTTESKAVCLEAKDQTEMPFLQYMAAIPLYRHKKLESLCKRKPDENSRECAIQ